jgi:hypothetical protein
MNLLLNDDSGRLKIVDFPLEAAKREQFALRKRLSPMSSKGATIVAVMD